MPYQEAWDFQTELLEEKKRIKLHNRRNPEDEPLAQSHHFLFCEHPHVYTLGKSGSPDHLLLSKQEQEDYKVSYFKINRGGDITYHGPGQVVGYPILDLDHFFTDVHKYVRLLEETIIRTLAEYDIIGKRIPDYTGVWIENNNTFAKICAIGVHLSRWITMHGFALNVNTDLSFFNHIIPCGIDDSDKEVTSMEKVLGKKIDMQEVKSKICHHFEELYNCKFIYE